MDKLPMHAVVPKDFAGTGDKYRRCRIVARLGEDLIPICWTFLATDGSVHFSLAMGDVPLSETGAASICPAGKISLDTKQSLEHIPPQDRQKTHVTLHRSGICHIRADRARPIIQHRLENWFPVKAGFVWIQAYTAPIRTLPRIQTVRSRDAVMPFSSMDVSARIEVAIHPRTPDASVPLVNGEIYTFAGISPHHIVRVSVDAHAPLEPTVLVRTQLGEIQKQAGNA